MKLLITGGAGFIGSSLIKYMISNTDYQILNLDKLTYSGNLQSLSSVEKNSRYKFIKGDICNKNLVSKIFNEFRPNWVMNLAAESHVDRSIESPNEFLRTNIIGTSVMLEAARLFWKQLPNKEKSIFRFLQISTDEVYGSLGKKGFFTEKSSYQPSSPYSASKASSDHLVRSWHITYGLPVLITNCSNNYGFYQFPEKLIPLVILNAIEGKTLPIYGDGQQIRDWLFVEDHVEALHKVISEGKIGETYLIGGNNEKKNIEVVQTICDLLDEIKKPLIKKIHSHRELIKFVDDRPGHDLRYAIDSKKINDELNWKPKQTFNSGLELTIKWYLKNLNWCKNIQGNSYQRDRVSLL